MASQRWLRVGNAVGALLLAAAWLGRGQVARADVAPDPYGSGVGRDAGPIQITAVQMVSETVIIEIAEVVVDPYWNEERGPALAGIVTADFLLRNPTTATETLPVGFPQYLGSEQGLTPPETRDLSVYQNNSAVADKTVTINGDPWSVWTMAFPPGDTQVRVTYFFVLETVDPGKIVDIRYILHTGAGWAGPIGQADLRVSFPYLAEANFIDARSSPAGYRVEGYDVAWHLENLEPTTADDLVLRVVHPGYWKDRVITARQAVTANPAFETYLELARVYRQLVTSYDPTVGADNTNGYYSPLLAQVTEAQFRKALEIDYTNRDANNQYFAFVNRYAGTLLPGKASDYTSSFAPTETLTPWPTYTVRAHTQVASELAATATMALAVQTLSPTVLPQTATLVATATPPSTQVAALPTAPLFTPVPIPSVDGGGNTLNTVLLVAFVALIAVGLVIALRRR